ncbi:MAG: thiamine phosphate synthase [Planctomycetaceae bacterium]|nr:thiamine phosphate synthase [Planctomycetaceae bacterium]
MRFDLTNASYRVLKRAALKRLPDTSSEISAAKVLLSLFEEEECLAAAQLADAGVTFAQFETEPATLEQDAEANTHSKVRFYLDDEPVDLGRITRELESALEIVVLRAAGQNGSERPCRVPAGKGVVNRDTLYFPAFSLATKHLLLAAVLDEGYTGNFLRGHGLDAAELFQKAENNKKIDDEKLLIDNEISAACDDLANGNNCQLSTNNEQFPPSLFRVIDAAANRCREGIRVIEDYVRFVLDDAALTRRCKEFRHTFQDVLATLPMNEYLEHRDTEHDAGTDIEGQNEYRRTTLTDVLTANFARIQESLRSIEEYSKIITPDTARQFEQLRYRSYTLHKVAAACRQTVGLNNSNDGAAELNEVAHRQQLLNAAKIYALLDCRNNEEHFKTAVDALINGGVDIIQLRDKTAAERAILARSKILKERIAVLEKDVLFIMNDRPDLAVLADADGVHIGQDELSVAAARKIIGTGKLVGVSTHNIGQARQAVLDGADYIGVGPVFASATKHFTEQDIAGLDYLKEIAAENIAVPAFAVGGITPENVNDVAATGIRRVALSSALLNAENIQQTAGQVIAELLPRS